MAANERKLEEIQNMEIEIDVPQAVSIQVAGSSVQVISPETERITINETSTSGVDIIGSDDVVVESDNREPNPICLIIETDSNGQTEMDGFNSKALDNIKPKQGCVNLKRNNRHSELRGQLEVDGIDSNCRLNAMMDTDIENPESSPIIVENPDQSLSGQPVLHEADSSHQNNIIDLDSITDRLEEMNEKDYSSLPHLKSEDVNTVPNDSTEANPCCVSIHFNDETTADLYKAKFIKFVNTFTELHVKNETSLSVELYKDDGVLLTDSETSSPPKKRKKHSKAKRELFVLDATPSSNTPPAKLIYTTKFTINTERSEDANRQPAKQQAKCFNCEDLHQLRDCPHPKDYNRINTARQSFKPQPKANRYHSEDEQKYGHLQPGKISKELRKALGLHRDEAPRYIYLMRRLGYPPGWLEEAKLVQSSLDVIGIDGSTVKEKTKRQGLDESKVVEYPGFNAPMEKGIRDDHRVYKVPPYSSIFNKQTMINFFAWKCVTAEDDVESCDIDDQKPESAKPADSRHEVKETTNDCDSPSLIDLERQKQQLLSELSNESKVETAINPDKDSDKEYLTVKTSFCGTPILKSTSPFMSLPDADNFSKDVSPLINFENLPNSTGKYEQLTDVLVKVRNTLKKINADSS